jgi:hypothetical protein
VYPDLAMVSEESTLFKVRIDWAQHCSELQGLVASISWWSVDVTSGARNSSTEQVFFIVKGSQVNSWLIIILVGVIKSNFWFDRNENYKK